jgi:hypothetical protein
MMYLYVLSGATIACVGMFVCFETSTELSTGENAPLPRISWCGATGFDEMSSLRIALQGVCSRAFI